MTGPHTTSPGANTPQAGGRRVRLEAVRRLGPRQVLVRMWWWRPSLGELALLLAGIAVIHLVTGWAVAVTAVGTAAFFVVVTLLVAVSDLADAPADDLADGLDGDLDGDLDGESPAHGTAVGHQVGTHLSGTPVTTHADNAPDDDSDDVTDHDGDSPQGGAR